MKLGAVIAAAGLSLRMGREKILLRFGEGSVLERVLTSLAVTGVEEPVVVLRPGLLRAEEQARDRGARVVLNSRPEEEMLLSIRLGIAELPLHVDAFYVWPADHPAVAVETLSALAGSAGRDRVVIPCYRSRRGHPALVGSRLRDAIGQIPPGEGLRSLWRVLPEILHEVAVEDPGVLLDLNTPEDYEIATKKDDGGGT